MPYINVRCGALQDEQKRKIIAEFTSVGSKILGVPEEFFQVTIDELPDSCYGIGGRQIDIIKKEHKGR